MRPSWLMTEWERRSFLIVALALAAAIATSAGFSGGGWAILMPAAAAESNGNGVAKTIKPGDVDDILDAFDAMRALLVQARHSSREVEFPGKEWDEKTDKVLGLANDILPPLPSDQA